MSRIADDVQANGSNCPNRYIPITLRKINKGSATYLAKRITDGIDSGIFRFQIRVAPNAPCYPNYIAPLAGTIDYFKGRGITFLSSRSLRAHDHLARIGLLNPYIHPEGAENNGNLNRIWKFAPDTHYQIVSGIMENIRSGLEVERGVLQSVELCLNEITDNVLNHSVGSSSSKTPSGFLMAQIHSN